MLLDGLKLDNRLKSKYRISNETLTHVMNKDRRDFTDFEIGDIKQPSFMPQVKMKRFDNECNLSLRLKHSGKGKESVKIDGDKIVWKKGKSEAHFYDIGEGYEIDVILDEKPSSNLIEFTIQTKGLTFFYQPELTEEEKSQGVERPENVVGSYAVYFDKPKKNVIGGKKYRSGKVGHIFRPKIFDSAGAEVWGDMNIDVDAGILSVSIPQDFLDNAQYPVTVDPIMGTNTIGGSTYLQGDESAALCSLYNQYTAVSGDVLRGIAFYAEEAFDAETVAVSLYRVESNTPTSKFGAGGSKNVNSGDQWWDASGMSDSLTAGHIYGVAYGGWGGNASAGEQNTRIWGDSGSGANTSRRELTEQSLPSTWDQDGYYTNVFSIYAYFKCSTGRYQLCLFYIH